MLHIFYSSSIFFKTSFYQQNTMSGCNFGEKFERKIRLLRDAQVERRGAKQKFENQQKLTKLNICLTIGKRLRVETAHQIIQFISYPIPISEEISRRQKNIELEFGDTKPRHIVQAWIAGIEPRIETGNGLLFPRVAEHFLRVNKENVLADLSSPNPSQKLNRGTLAAKTYREFKERSLKCEKTDFLKSLCRGRYLKVGGSKSKLVERLMAEKW
jgi:hypothetical protein